MRHWVSVLLVCFLLTGCGSDEEKLVPVRGRVTVEKKPWSVGDIGFFPDAAKGNHRGRASIGSLKPDGSFELFTSGKPGVPLGWYKVVVWATNDPAAANPWGSDGKPRPIKWLIDSRYTSLATTPLAVEVVENPSPDQYEVRIPQ